MPEPLVPKSKVGVKVAGHVVVFEARPIAWASDCIGTAKKEVQLTVWPKVCSAIGLASFVSYITIKFRNR